MGTLVFETERMRLRDFTHADVDALAAMFADPQHMRFYPRPKSRAEAVEWIEWNLGLYAERGFGLWVMESKATGEFLGNCGLTPQTVEGHAEIELGWHTAPAFKRQGLATEAATACRDYGFGELGLSRIIGIIDPANVPSRGLAEKIGMTVEKTALFEGKPNVIYATTGV